MKRAHLSILALAGTAAAICQTPADTFQSRQSRLARIASSNVRPAKVKRGMVAPPAELSGKIVESKPNSDGSVTIQTNRGSQATFDPQQFRPIYDPRRDITLFGLIPEQSMSVGASYMHGDGWNLVRTSLGYTFSPRARATEPDSIGTWTTMLAWSNTHVDGFGDSRSWSGHFDYQLNSDADYAQLVGGIDVDVAIGSLRSLLYSLSVTKSLSSTLGAGISLYRADQGAGIEGNYVSFNAFYSINEQVLFYADYQPATHFTGDMSWDFGFQAAIAPRLSLTLELDKDQVWLVAISHRFKT
jgi:hypothetical protein